MKGFFFVLLAANLAAGAWLLLGDPVDIVREPARAGLQIAPERFRVLSEADLALLRSQAERNAAAATAAAAPVDAPLADCVEIGDFASEAAARKARARLAAGGVGQPIAIGTLDHATRLRIAGVDPETEVRIDQVLKDYPRQQLVHCTSETR
jgi:hypothetical protein